MYPSFFGFSLRYIPITKTCCSPLLNHFYTFSTTKDIFHRRSSSGGSCCQSPKVTLLLDREGEGEGRCDPQYYYTLNSKRRLKSCVKHGWCSPYLSTDYIGSGQGGKSMYIHKYSKVRSWETSAISLCSMISVENRAHQDQFAPRSHTMLLLHSGICMNELLDQQNPWSRSTACTIFSCSECWTIWSSKFPSFSFLTKLSQSRPTDL